MMNCHEGHTKYNKSQKEKSVDNIEEDQAPKHSCKHRSQNFSFYKKEAPDLR